MMGQLTTARDELGFTLVEMLVALTIFALLAAAGVGLLRASVDTQGAVDRRLKDVSGVARLNAVLSNDLFHIVRPMENPSQSPLAFVGNPGGMEFVRSGRSSLGEMPRSSLVRVAWRFEQGTVSRSGGTNADQASDSAPARLMKDVRQARFRYRLASGAWSERFETSAEERLPHAVEVTVAQAGGPTLTIIAALPADGVDGVLALPAAQQGPGA